MAATSRRPTSNEATRSEPGRGYPAGLVCAGLPTAAEPGGAQPGGAQLAGAQPAGLGCAELPSASQAMQPQPQNMLRLRLDLRYDGSAFHGWATQPGLTTVQQTVQDALWRVLRLAEPPALTVAGRTDAGVHARGQVAHTDIEPETWAAAAGSAERRLARLLPPSVRVTAIGPAPDGFDARFSALWRRYSYRVCDDRPRLTRCGATTPSGTPAGSTWTG